MENNANMENFSAELAFIPLFNLALQQNALPVIYELKLINNTDKTIENLNCIFSATPDFIHEKAITVQKINSHEELVLDRLDIKLNYNFLSSLSERVKCELRLQITDCENILFKKNFDCEAFAPDQWLGPRVMPELLASFVTPNLEVVAYLQSQVAYELERATGSASIQGYQADKKRVYEICAAIYRAIHNWGIQYSNPASSFGSPGQRIRFADTIYQYKLGTCLDTTILFASVMESCGLHPVIMLQKGHAYIGCHLVDNYFPDIPMDDLQTIRKLADLDEFLVVETTMVTREATFAEAEAFARTRHLNVDDEFECAIDVLRARNSRIYPLPLKRSVNGIEFDPVDRNIAQQEAEKARRLEKEIDLSKLSNENKQPPRVEKWKNKLLDLSLRNRLLNTKDTNIIPIACSDISTLEDKIADEESLTLNPLSDLLSEKDVHDLTMLRNCDIKTDIKTLLDQELAQQRLWTTLSLKDMMHRLTALYRKGKTDLEEGGVNTIFLALGFVEWRVSERDEKSYCAPILLLPVRLQRKSITDGIKISRVDGETVINETLLELLRSQYNLTIPGISPLPVDKSGVDVSRVMQIFRQAIKDMKGWEVREEACIGHFSFGKFVMWYDMTARLEVLKQTPLISHLISGGGLFDDGIEVFPPEEISRHLDLSRLYCPVSADSSQLAAVLYSELGKSFVLHGPPGTGKSQTITNIIAHNLALGKKVLFVSEKKAALDVVHKRLSQIGLKPFCLELHSNKSGKSEVLAQFNEALYTADPGIPATEWENTVAVLDALRKELDGHVKELHRQYPNGFSAYDCFVHLLDYKDLSALPTAAMESDLLTQSHGERLQARQKFIDMAEARQHVETESLQGLNILSPLQWSPIGEDKLREAAKGLQEATENLIQKFSVAAEYLSLHTIHAVMDIYQTALIMEELKEYDDIPGAFFCDEFSEKVDFITKFSARVQCLPELRNKLHSYRLEKFTDFDFAGIAERIARNEGSFFLIKFFRNNALLKELAELKKSGGVKLSIQELKALIPDAQQYIDTLKAYNSGKDKAAALLGKEWNEEETKWESLQQKIDQAKKIIAQVDVLAKTDRQLKEAVLNKLQELMPDISSRCQHGSGLRNDINDMLEAWNIFHEKRQIFAEYSHNVWEITDITALHEKVGNVIKYIPALRNVMRYRNLYNEVSALSGIQFADVVEKVTGVANWEEFYDRIFFKNMLDQILEHSPLLCQFSGATQNERIKKFGEFDAKYMTLTKKLIFARLAANLPRRRSDPRPAAGTELFILKHECEKRSRHLPVRKLLEKIPNLAPVLKPCFLMSPLSVAQYLPAESAPFDLIVFDEASQIPVWDAIGVIARGKQLIVVGDPKQMPPTNFFQKGDSENDEYDSELTEDLESILDECIAAGVHSTYLNWHYRSRHESLIAFSNHHYYDDRLYTFPAARNTEKLGIRFEFIADGVYDRKNTRTNRKEAEAMVRYIFDRLERSEGKFRSIGVVTFSQAQKDLIEDLLEEERPRHPALETYFSDSAEEPLFVKNLENVQGDERDVILFSIGYAPDINGNFSMNFGPLNRQGGERRLNVAITRAKEQVVVFSSIHANQIDLNRTQAVGAAHLKSFLDYAENKSNIYSAATVEKGSDGLRDAIAGFLTEKGYKVEKNVGCSGFRIDLAVKHPEKPEEYLLGIECDNVSYAAQHTTRDRDNLRNQVLKGLGWHIYRAWCVDWKFGRSCAEDDLLAFIEKVKNEVPQTNSVAAEPEDDLPMPETAAMATAVTSERCKGYHIWSNHHYVFQEDFYEPAGQKIIKEQISEIIEQEAPIYEHLLKRRIVKAWGFNRAGGNIQKTLESCMPKDLQFTRYGGYKVLWSKQQTPAEYEFYRVGTGVESKRAIDEIPPEELANAMYEILKDFNSCPPDTLFRETLKIFGLFSVTQKARNFLGYGLEVLQKNGKI